MTSSASGDSGMAAPRPATCPGPARIWGSGGEQISMDAFDFCRAVSGRGPATGLLSEQVPF